MEIPADYNYEGETYSPLQTKFTSNNDADTYTTFSVRFRTLQRINLLACRYIDQLGEFIRVPKLSSSFQNI